MTSDITCDATVKYIIDNEQYLDLAFRVEEAMPIVRQRLFREVLEGIERKFSTEWIIFSPYRDHRDHRDMKPHSPLITFRKRSWRGYTDTDRKTGIMLAADDERFEKAYVALDVNFAQQHLKGSEEFFVNDLQKLESYRRAKIEQVRDKGESIIWKYMQISLTERKKVVDQLVDMIERMATEIDSTMNKI